MLDKASNLPGAVLRWLRHLGHFDKMMGSSALLLMVLIPLIEISLRPLMGRGVENAPILVQHFGLVMAMFGAVAAERGGHLASFGSQLSLSPRTQAGLGLFANASAAMICGALAQASWLFVASEMNAAAQNLAYGVPAWVVQMSMPLCFTLLAMRLGARCGKNHGLKAACGLFFPVLGWITATSAGDPGTALWPVLAWLGLMLLAGAPVFSVLGGLALALFWHEGLPLASVPLSNYQITVNPSLPSLPLFTLSGLIIARTGAAVRLGAVFIALFGGGVTGSVIASAVLCSFFTAFTGGSGVTILALGGLLLPLLRKAGFPESRGISLVTSASALGVLLAPSVPLIMYAIIARVPINTMFLAGVIPACVMVIFLLVFGGYLRSGAHGELPLSTTVNAGMSMPSLAKTLWVAKWELLAPAVAIGSLVSGLATPVESAALTVAYVVCTQTLAHRELNGSLLRDSLDDGAQIIGGVMLILGMALGLTNYLIDAGVPDDAIAWVQEVIPNKFFFLVALNVFLLVAGALMEIFAAIVVLVPLLLPLAVSYGVDPVHFGIIFLANLEMGFLCPPAGMNVFFASAMFKKPLRHIAISVFPALLALFLATLFISWFPMLATGLPELFLGKVP